MAEIKAAISDGSVGFLTTDGRLKSAKENAAAEQKIQNSESNSTQQLAQEDSTEPSLSNGLAAVRKKTNEDVNDIIQVINTDRDNLSDARVTLKDLKQTAIELKQAIKNGDTVEASTLRNKFENLQAERDSIAKRTEDDNQRLITERVQDVNVGNKQIGRIQTNEVKVSYAREVDTTNVRDLNEFIKQTDEELESIKGQLAENKETREQTRSLASEARAEINRAEEQSLRQVKDAEELAQKISTQLKQLGSGSLELIHKNISQAAVDALLRS